MLFPFDKVRPFIHRNVFAACGSSDKVSITLNVTNNRYPWSYKNISLYVRNSTW